MYRKEKIAFGKSILGDINNSTSALLCQCEGLTAVQMSKMRLAIREVGGFVQMGGNRILSKVLEQTKFKTLIKELTGNNCIIFFSGPFIGLTNILSQSLKAHKNKINFKYGMIDDQELNLSNFSYVSKFKSEAQVYGTLLAALNSPVQSLAIFAKQYYELSFKEGKSESNE